MCGIIGYVGYRDAVPILLQGLRRLEYRGYDSAGLVVIDNGNASGEITRVRAVGKVDNLADKVKILNTKGNIGIAHTRWATHGGVTEENAHPHIGKSGNVAICHNGIIENYRELKVELSDRYVFSSQTDTEVLAHLIDSYYSGDLKKAVMQALLRVHGTYGLVVVHADHPDIIVAARMGSPLVIGLSDNEMFIASDATPLLGYTKKVVYMNDGEIAELSASGLNIVTSKDEHVKVSAQEVEWSLAEAEKGGFPHFMLKEIFDQPQVLEDAIRGRYVLEDGTARLGGLNMTDEQMRSVDRIVLLACGTASYAALIGKYAFERLSGIPTEVEIASEFRYRDPIITPRTLVFAISQSGETADTLAALREAKRKGAMVRGIVNMVGSTIARETDGGTYIHAGPELAVASTKAYTNMVAVLMLYALQFGRLHRLSEATGERLLQALLEIPKKMRMVLERKEDIFAIADNFTKYSNCYFLGRGVNYPVALEGSLKLKEISYIHSEAYPGGEMKHGPIALLSTDFPVVAVLTKNQLYEKMRSNIEEIAARKAPLVLLATDGDEKAKELSNNVLYVPETMELLEPLLNTIVFQLFAYRIAVKLGKDVDRPRNLAKSVTVE